MRISQFDFTANSMASWENEHTLCIWVRPLNAVGQRQLKFVFSEDKVTVIPGSTPDAASMMKYLSGFAVYFVKPGLVIKAAQIILSKGDRFLESKHRGRMK
jgi:hypothetical protein